MIVKTDHKFELRSRTTGRVLGTHPSYARALRQERAIKASQARAAHARRNPWIAEPTYVDWSDEAQSWCVFGANSGYCYATFPKRHQAERYAHSQPIRTGRVYEGAGALANPSKKKGFRELQDDWRKAYDAQESFSRTISLKYGSRWQSHWISKGELSKLNKLKEKTSAASDRFIEWLDQNSPYDFLHGVNVSWLRDKLTEEQALSSESPLLPAEATSYGYEAREFRPAKKNPRRSKQSASASPQMREPGETDVQYGLRRWLVPAIGIGAAAAFFWWMSGPPQLLQSSQIAIQQRPLPDFSNLTDAQRSQIVRVAQTQLKQLGYNITGIDGVSGPETQAAMTAFMSANANVINASGSRYGQGEPAIVLTLDDVYRQRFGLSAAT